MNIKLKNREIIAAHQAIKSIPGLKKSTEQGVYGLAKNQKKLADAIGPVEDANRALFKEHFGDETQVDQKHPRWLAYQEAARVLDAIENELDIHQVQKADVKATESEIAPATLALLWFMFSDW